MIWQRNTRRMFLRGAGGATLAIPFLPSLLPSSQAHAAGAAPRRFIAVKSYSAQKITDWYPTVANGSYQLKNTVFPKLLAVDGPRVSENTRQDGTTHLTALVASGAPYTVAPLSDFKIPSVSRLLSSAFNRYLEKMLLLRGLDYLPDTNHNDGGMLGNFAGANSSAAMALAAWPTIDQVMAYSTKVYPQPPALRSLHLSPGAYNSVSFTDDGKRGGAIRQVQARVDPQVAFQDAFARFRPATPQAGAPPRRLVDGVIEDYERLGNNQRLSSDDKQLLERHVAFLAELQAELATTRGGGSNTACGTPVSPPSLPNEPPSANLEQVDDVRKTYELMIDVLVAAVMCDQTRVITLDLRKALGTIGGKTVGVHHFKSAPGSWHGYAHDWGVPESDRIVFSINDWIAKDIILRILDKLDVVEGEGKTFLDNSVVYWGNELGFNHVAMSIPTVMFGSMGGYLKTGRYIDYTDWNSRLYFGQHGGNVIRGIPYNQLLVTLLQGMGLSPADYERPGQKGYGETKIVGKGKDAYPTDYDLAKVGDVLPGAT